MGGKGRRQPEWTLWTGVSFFCSCRSRSACAVSSKSMLWRAFLCMLQKGRFLSAVPLFSFRGAVLTVPRNLFFCTAVRKMPFRGAAQGAFRLALPRVAKRAVAARYFFFFRSRSAFRFCMVLSLSGFCLVIFMGFCPVSGRSRTFQSCSMSQLAFSFISAG